MPDHLKQPAHLTPHLVVLERVAGEYRTIATRYWGWSGMRNISPVTEPHWTSSWAETTSAIADEFGESANQLHLIAAAALEAQLPDVECPPCAAPVAVKSRTALDEIARGAAPEENCARCDQNLQDKVAKLLDPTRYGARKARKEEAVRRKAEREAQLELARHAAGVHRELQRVRREAVTQTYPQQCEELEFADFDMLGAVFGTEASTLAILDHAPSTDPVSPVKTWDAPLTPDVQGDVDALVGAFHAGLLRIHPESEVDAFVWGEDDPAVLTSGYFPRAVAWYVPCGATPGEAAERLRTSLRTRTHDWLLTRRGVHDVTAMMAQLIVDETMRYLDHQLDIHHLPAVPAHKRPRLIEYAERLAQTFSLGQCYSVSWRAARNAATMAQRHPRAPLDSATSHAVNTFEEMVTRATTEPGYALQEYSTDSRNPLSALTKTVMVTILEADPMAATVPGVGQSLREVPGYPRAASLSMAADDGTAAEEDMAAPSPPQGDTSISPASLAGLLADVLTRLKDDVDVERVDDWLIAGYQAILEGNDLHEDSIEAVADGLDRLTALRAAMQTLDPVPGPQQQLTALFSLAFLMPGVADTNHGSTLPLGQVLGYELTWAMGLNGDF